MSLDDLSGPWQGRWWQGRITGFERLDLVIQGGSVLGFGVDADGEFQYSGVIHTDGCASLRKVYTRPLTQVPASMSYVGQWNGELIQGEWMDDAYPSSNHGPFRMWPKRRGGPALEEGKAVPIEETGSLELEPVRTPGQRQEPVDPHTT